MHRVRRSALWRSSLGVLACSSVALICRAQGLSQLPDALKFELPPSAGHPGGWNSWPAQDIFADDQIVHGGKRSARIERRPDSGDDASGINLTIPIDFAGQKIELRGFVRTEDVKGFAALWMREDGDGARVAFDSMQKLQIGGTTDWRQYSISVPVAPQGKQLTFGFLMTGSGKAWADDLELLVDGKPVWDAPKAPPPKTVLDTDHEFDAGSKIVLTTLSRAQTENLATLGKVWGFLKYHHPEVTAGKRHWDYDLFRILPAILNAPDRQAANTALANWIQSLGEAPPCQQCARLDEAELHLRPDVEWIRSAETLGGDLSRQLQAAYRNRTNGPQFYVSWVQNVRNPVFQIEPAYAGVHFPDPGFQLLALYRFWTIIEYWFPYRDTIGESWDGVLADTIPKIALARSSDEYKLEMMKLIARVHDTHANLWSSLDVRPPQGPCRVPVTVRFVEGRPVVAGYTDPASANGAALQRGDVIESLDGVGVTDLVQKWKPYYAASNEPTALRDIAASFTRGACGGVKIRVRRAGEVVDVATARVSGVSGNAGATHDIPGEAFRKLSPEVAYIKISDAKSADAAKYVDQSAGTKGLIIDIRNYPSDFPIFALGSLLVDKETTFARFTAGDPANPGAFHFGPSTALKPARPHYGGKVIILVDEISQSSAEYHAMAFRTAPGALVIGSTTAGADGNTSAIPLPGGLRSMISGIGVFYPDKRPTQRAGIVPDVEVKPTIAGIRAGRDEVLEAAVRKIVGPEVPAAEIEKIARAGRN